ncbi:hypothetical protein PWT90_07818 [Aphanocladium album]|nr:hypothetical protein PWT90_07818 [Aphanocladium album]
MAPRFGDQLLQVFDVPAEAYDFLVSVLDDKAAPPYDLKLIFDQSLIAGAESWYHQLDRDWDLDSSSQALSTPKQDDAQVEDPWAATDRLIQHAQSLANEAAVSLLPCSQSKKKHRDKATAKAKRQADAASSHYWSQDGDESFVSPTKGFRLAEVPSTAISRLNIPAPGLQPSCVYPEEPNGAHESIHTNAGVSPYFATPTKAPRPVVPRPSPGIVSCLPFPPLASESFGLIQEQVAHDPFWLLIAVSFLVKTKGEHAIPVFLRVKERFPAPCDIVNPENADEIFGMIQHLGLGKNRLGLMQKYAHAFMFDPPRSGVRYRVHYYETREIGRPLEGHLAMAAENVTDGWEIGHMTQGRYTVDSWRIFCRDVLLGRAKDWDGKGAKGEFQPEWMRVLPADKELRAYLRWMWMREGWEWDPATGERKVLREEMRRAVNEGRVAYDIYGELQIVGES